MTQLASDPARTRPAQAVLRAEAGREEGRGARPEPGPSEPGKDESPAGRAAQTENEAAEAVMGLDMLLVDAAQGPLRRLIPPAGTALRFGSALARQPGTVAGRAGELAREVAKIAAGSSELAPSKKDKRFADPAWSGNGLLRRAMQLHLATARTAWELIEDADLDWKDDERIRFTATNLVDALAPSNVPGAQPALAEGGHRHRREERRPSG